MVGEGEAHGKEDVWGDGGAGGAGSEGEGGRSSVSVSGAFSGAGGLHEDAHFVTHDETLDNVDAAEGHAGTMHGQVHAQAKGYVSSHADSRQGSELAAHRLQGQGKSGVASAVLYSEGAGEEGREAAGLAEASEEVDALPEVAEAEAALGQAKGRLQCAERELRQQLARDRDRSRLQQGS